MRKSEPAGRPAPPERAFTEAMERFSRLLRILSSAPAPGIPAPSGAESLTGHLAADLEQWLRESQLMLTGLHSDAFRAPEHGNERTPQLLARWTQSHAKLTTLWNLIALEAIEKFTASAGVLPASFTPQEVRRLYDLWIDCAEQAYAAVAHTYEYASVQADLINTATALLMDQRRAAGSDS